MIYLDTSFLTPLFREEATSAGVAAFLEQQPSGTLAISLWTCVEFASVMARDVRMGALPKEIAATLLKELDALEASLHVAIPGAADFRLAQSYVGGFGAELRAPDALHLAIVKNHGFDEIISLDLGLLRACKRLKINGRRGIR